MERYETPGVEVTTPLEVTLMAQAMAMLEAGIWTWSAGQGLRRDPSCLQLLGLEGELGDLGWLDRVHPDDAPRLAEALEACQQGRSNGLRLEYRILHHQGHYIRLEERVRRDEGVNCWGWFAIWMPPWRPWRIATTGSPHRPREPQPLRAVAG
jgi:PAS domain-containing protein